MAYEFFARERWDPNPPGMGSYSHVNFGPTAVIHHTASTTGEPWALEGKPGPKWYSMIQKGKASLATRRAVKAYEKKKAGVTALEIKAMRGWKAYHQSKGWTDIGYHLIIFPSGHVYEGRPWNTRGAHAINGNHMPGVSFAGNFEVEKPTKQALYAFNVVRQEKGIKTLVGHYSLPGNWTACPGKNLKAALGV